MSENIEQVDMAVDFVLSKLNRSVGTRADYQLAKGASKGQKGYFLIAPNGDDE